MFLLSSAQRDNDLRVANGMLCSMTTAHKALSTGASREPPVDNACLAGLGKSRQV